jgi:NitT/TauT family transport system ATP-binding protein
MPVPLPLQPAPGLADRQTALVVLERVCKTYGTGANAVPALLDVSLSIPAGQFISILGPSGCGKSTLLMIAAGLVASSSGRVTLRGTEVRGPRTDLGIVFQSPTLLEWRDALGNVLLQAEARHMPRQQATARARELLRQVGLEGFEHRRPRELSGGMRQRVAICRALLHNPELILMDEPFGALDALTRDQMSLDMQRLWQQGDKTVLFVTHSVQEAVFLSDRLIVMSPRPGRVVLDLPIDLPRPRRLQTRELAEFNGYVGQVLATLSQGGVLRDA